MDSPLSSGKAKWEDASMLLPNSKDILPIDSIESIKSQGEQLLKEESDLYFKRLPEHEKSFYTSITQSGTSSNRISALALRIQESPLHCINTLEALLRLTSSKSKTEAVSASEAMKDLFINQLLPNRRLNSFETSIQMLRDISKDKLIKLVYEDRIRGVYSKFLVALEKLLHDSVEYSQTKALNTVFELLCSKPEQEKSLLRLLVFELGAKLPKVASKAIKCILLLESSHPKMKPYIFKEIQAFIAAKQLVQKDSPGLYFSIVTLNQTIILKSDKEFSIELLTFYFRILEVIFATPASTTPKKNGKIPSKPSSSHPDSNLSPFKYKLLTAIFVGIRRTWPFVSSDSSEDVMKPLIEKLDVIYRLAHTSPQFAFVISALTLLTKILPNPSSKTNSITHMDRVLRLLYSLLLDIRLINASKVHQRQYLSIVYEVMLSLMKQKSDSNVAEIISAFIKRLLQSLTFHDVPFTMGVLLILKNIKSNYAKFYFPNSSNDDFKYDNSKRDPKFAHADYTMPYELALLGQHYRPSIARVANEASNDKSLKNQDFLFDLFDSLKFSEFLNYFIPSRQPRKQDLSKGSNSLMQRPLNNTQDDASSPTTYDFSSKRYLGKNIHDIPEDLHFIFYFFNQKKIRKLSNKPIPDEDEPVKKDSEPMEDLLSDHDVNDMLDSDSDNSYTAEQIKALLMDDDSDNPDSNEDDFSSAEEEDETVFSDVNEGDSDATETSSIESDMDDDDDEDQISANADSAGSSNDLKRQKKWVEWSEKKLKGQSTFASAEDFESYL